MRRKTTVMKKGHDLNYAEDNGLMHLILLKRHIQSMAVLKMLVHLKKTGSMDSLELTDLIFVV